MRSSFTLFFVVFCFMSNAQFSAFGEVIAENGTNRGYAIAYDSEGSIIISGTFSNAFDADPGPNEMILDVLESFSASGMLLKYDSDGQFQWAIPIGGDGSSTQWADDVAVDAENNIYVTGFFAGTCDFDPSENSSTLYGGEVDGYLAKYSSDGNLLWVREVSSADADRAHGLAISSNGDVLISGFLSPNAYIGDPSFSLSASDDGGYVCSFDADGNVNWIKVFQADATCNPLKIAVDDQNNIYGIGIFSESVDLDPGVNEYMIQATGGDDMFFFKLDDSGEFLWGGRCGSAAEDWGYDLDVTGAGDVFLTGHYRGELLISPGNGFPEMILPLTGNSDILCLKLSTEGAIAWAHHLGYAASNARGISVAAGADGLPFFTGWFNNGLTLDDSDTPIFVAGESSSDLFLVQFDENAQPNYSSTITGESAQEGRGIAISDEGVIYLTGLSSGAVDLDPGDGVIEDTSDGVATMYLRLTPEAGTSVDEQYANELLFSNPLRAGSPVLMPMSGDFSIWNLDGKLLQSYPAMSKNQSINLNLTTGNYVFGIKSEGAYKFQRIQVVR